MPSVRAAEFLFLSMLAVFAVAVQPKQSGNIGRGGVDRLLRSSELLHQVKKTDVIDVLNTPGFVQLVDKIEQVFKSFHRNSFSFRRHATAGRALAVKVSVAARPGAGLF